MPIAEVTVIPIGTGSTSLSSYVADMQRVLKTVEGITYELTSMGTIIEEASATHFCRGRSFA